MEHPPTDIALVHEWLSSRAGSEKTFEQMAITLPQADLYALSVDSSLAFDFGRPVVSTILQRSRYLCARRDLALPLMPIAWKALRTMEYKAVVTSSHAFARYFPAKGAVHLSYVYTPLRYAWMPEVDGRAASPVLAPARSVLRSMDRRSTRGVSSFAAISSVVADRIRTFYGRDAEVIYPPVDVAFYGSGPSLERGDFVLGVSRWIPYKRLDLTIAAAEQVGLPVVIAGSGPLETELRERAAAASVPVTIVHQPSDEELRSLYRRAAVVVFPADEDFGIVPVEAQAAGAPVVALRRGGSLDTVLDGKTGVLVDAQDAEVIARGVEQAIGLDPTLEPSHLDQFSIASFRREFRQWVDRNLG